MNVYIREAAHDSSRKPYRRFRFPVARYDRQRIRMFY
jgi:hypothetical protein